MTEAHWSVRLRTLFEKSRTQQPDGLLRFIDRELRLNYTRGYRRGLLDGVDPAKRRTAKPSALYHFPDSIFALSQVTAIDG